VQRVFAVSNTRQQFMPCTPARARMLLRGRKADYAKRGKTAVWVIDLQHRGQAIKDSLDSRRGIRRGRRNRKTRYRASRFDNRTRADGCLAPSLMSRVYNVMTWALRLQRVTPLRSVDGYSYLSKTGAPLGFEKPSIRAQEVS